ncbi:MAG: isoleucine--tRNA ligase [Thermoproteota archaeon]|nr:isoleucine--tRNA ligase [Thermoproteota archaeon]
MKLNPKFDLKKIESDVRSYLDDVDQASILDNELSKVNSVLGYIEGPPTLNGEPHVGHLRGRVIKDIWYRFKTLQKYRVVFRAGWDTQGLPVELQAEKLLGLTGSKSENINRVGVDSIVNACKRLIKVNATKWIEVDHLLGMSFDYEKAYWTYKDEYIEREWKYMKKAWDLGILKEWFRVVAYCPSCQTSLSNAEVNQGYKNVEDPSFYYKLRMSEEDAFLIVWTTMPFTIITDELICVNPDATYAYVNVSGQVWIIGQDRLQSLMRELGIVNYELIDTVLGKDLEGRRYIHPLLHMIPGLKKLSDEKSIHFVVAERFVDISTGSGLVHLAPANGEEDFEVATRRRIPIFVPIDDKVLFTEEAGLFQNKYVRDTDEMVINAMREASAYIMEGKIVHQYPTCWRSGHKIVWLARREYFYMIDKLGEKPLSAASKVDYFFDSPKNRFLEIIKEKVPWCISRERIWGTPLPIWKCNSCGKKEALFSRSEIVERASDLPDGTNFELHRPWIDRIQIKCSHCSNIMPREPFVLDTWHNSGASPYASLSDIEFERLIPASFLTEGIDQTRGWAYTLLMENVIMRETDQAPFRAFLFQGHILDEKGNKMSKSLGNVMDAKDLLSSNSVDLIRFYLLWKASPIDSLNFSLTELAARPYQVLNTIYNLHIYLHQNSQYDNFDTKTIDIENIVKSKFFGIIEEWIISKLQSLISAVTVSFERCRFNEGAKAIENFIINDLSQVYVPFTRDDLWDDSPNTLERRSVIYCVLSHALSQVDIMIHPLCPFISNYLYLMFFTTKQSLLIESWPKIKDSLINPKVEKNVRKVKEIVSLANSARMKAKIKRRWPISNVLVFMEDDELSRMDGLAEVMKTQMNTGSLEIVAIPEKKDVYGRLAGLLNHNEVKMAAKLKTKRIAPLLRNDLPKVLRAFDNYDHSTIIKTLISEGRYAIKYNGKDFEISKEDVELSYSAAPGYSMAETDTGDFLILIETMRNKDLVTKGLVKDLARNIQQLRKEKGHLPTEVLSCAHVSNLNEDEVTSLLDFKDDLAYLVRVKSVELSLQASNEDNYKEVEIDGRQLLLSIE